MSKVTQQQSALKLANSIVKKELSLLHDVVQQRVSASGRTATRKSKANDSKKK